MTVPDSRPLFWNWLSSRPDRARYRRKQMRAKISSPLRFLEDCVCWMGYPSPSVDDAEQALTVFKRLNTPNVFPGHPRCGEVQQAHRLLRESREFSQLMIAHPLLAMLILSPVALGEWLEGGSSIDRTLNFRCQLGGMILQRLPLREVCQAAGVSYHLRGVQAPAQVLVAVNQALMVRPELLGAMPPENRDDWLRAMAWATPLLSWGCFPPVGHLLWVGRHAKRILSHSRKGVSVPIPSSNWLPRLRTYMRESRPGERHAFSPRRDWPSTLRRLEAWEADKAAERSGALEQRHAEHLRVMPDAIFADGWRIVVLRTHGMLLEEGRSMRHCMGSSMYKPIEPDRDRAYIAASLRDARGQSKVSFELELPKLPAGRYALSEIRGKLNARDIPEQCKRKVFAWIDFLNEVSPERRTELTGHGLFDMREACVEALL